MGEGSWIVWPGTGILGGAPSLYHLFGKREQPSFLWTKFQFGVGSTVSRYFRGLSKENLADLELIADCTELPATEHT